MSLSTLHGPEEHASSPESLSDGVIAVDIGATKTVVARVHQGRFRELERFPTAADPEDELSALVAAIRGETGAGPVAVGIGAPGPLDSATGTILTPPNLPEWRNFPLASRLAAAVEAPVRVENDASLGALGEARFGSGRDVGSMYYLTLSTGIGAGYVLDGELVGGHAGMAGEVWALDPGLFEGAPSGENIIERCSGPGIVRSVERGLADGAVSTLERGAVDTRAIMAALAAGDPLAEAVVERGRAALTGLLMCVILAVAPEMVVLAGGLCTDPAWFVDPVRERLARFQVVRELSGVAIERARLWDQAVLYGAAALAADAATG